MNLPKDIGKAVGKLKKSPLQTKTFVFEMAQVESGDADETVNAFCALHGAMSMVLDRHNGKMIYRIIYREQ